MEREKDEASPPTNARAPQERGAGGKLRKPPSRKPPASPYVRPPETARRHWLSKLVDPARRVIANSATCIFPSFFSGTPSGATLTGPSSSTEDQGQWQTGEQGHTDDDRKSDLHLWTSESTEMASTGDISDKLKNNSDFVLHRQDEKGEQSAKNRLSDIEQLVKGNKFSRDEFNRLVDVLNSRAMDLPNVEQGRENASLIARNDHKELVVAHGLPKISNEQRHEELNEAIWGSSTPLGLSKVRDEIGASPIEIARAYMDSRASEAGPSYKNMIQTVESRVLHGDEAAIKSYDPPSLKSSTCWPGAVVQDTYVTSQSQRSRYGLYNFPRTPYSRTLLSKSKSRLTRMQGDYNRISSTLPHQSQTMYLQDKSKVDALESGYGSVGPIRRIRHKAGAQSSSRRPAYSSLNGPLQRGSSDINEGFMPAVAKNLEPDGTSCTQKPLGFEVGVPTVHMHTSLMARKILEHIDRNHPTPKEKSAELKLATKWKNLESSSVVGTVLSIEDNGLLKLKDGSPYNCDGLDGKKSTLRNEGQGNCHVDILPTESTDKSIDVRKEGTSTSNMNVCSSILRIGNDARTSQNSVGSEIFLTKSTKEDALKTLPFGGHPFAVNEEKKPLPNSSASKPVIPPISIKKPDSRWTLASDNSSGFTFPVSASPSVLSEPPTPSVMPSFSTGDQYQSKEKSTEPSYSFGLKRSTPKIVFSFPSTSSTAVRSDTGDIKFNFGSDEKARLSFSSFGKNTVCC